MPPVPVATPLSAINAPAALAPMSPYDGKDALIENFVARIEAKDPYTQGHSHHVRVVMAALLDCLPPEMTGDIDREALLHAAFLHDVGKIEVPDSVLNKNGALSGEEWGVMKRHPENGAAILENTVFRHLAPWVMLHHEHMDGSGYLGMKGSDIPLESRLIAVADIFSALRTYRIYRPARTIDETVGIMADASGPQLDPELIKHFLALDRDLLENLQCGCKPCDLRREALKAALAEAEREREKSIRASTV